MADKELQVILKAKDLAEHTLRVTSNCNRYPKKWRFSLVDKMQTKAITHCDELLFYIEMSQKLNIINMNSMEYWSKMVTDVKRMAIAWRTKDKQR